MGKSKELFMEEQVGAAPAAKKSMFNIRQDHASLLALIEENDGELTEELMQQLQLSNDGFEDKAISYGFVIKQMEAEAEIIANEVKRLNARKQRLEKRAETFKEILDSAMREFGYTEINTPLLTLSYRPSKPVELVEGFTDSILQYAEYAFRIREDKAAEAEAAGVTEDTLLLFDVKPTPSKSRIGDEIKQGVVVPGASMPERKNLQIR